jgi:hypothetical protein
VYAIFRPSGLQASGRLEVRVVVGAFEARDLLFYRAFARFDHVDVGIQVAIRIGSALGDVGDALAVRRPGGEALVVPTRGQLRCLAAADVEEPEVFALVGEKPGEVLLEVVAVDHDRSRLRRFFFALGRSGSLAITASIFPSGDQAKSETPPGKEVSDSASPASAGMTQTCVSASSSPRSERKAMRLPSGL